MQSSNITPNVYLTTSSSNDSRVLTFVSSIKVRNTVIDTGGSTCDLELINPQEIDYFLPTIGSYGKKTDLTGTDTSSTTDYDYSDPNNLKPISQQRIGVMDTVIIRLKNMKTSPSQDPREDSEIVFRGCVKGIQRSSSPTGGNVLILQLADFSEYLRMATALPLGIFSTISFSITGRGLVNNLIKYANRLYTGDWRFLGTNLYQSFNAAIQSSLTDNTIGSAVDSLSQQTLKNHAMAIPPFFYLENSNLISDVAYQQVNGVLNAIGINSIPKKPDETTDNTDPNNIIGAVITSLQSNIVNGLASGLFQQTPEDQDTINYYQVALQKDATNNELNNNINLNYQSNQKDISLDLIKGAEKYAWILSDLYLDKGLITFEHEKLWSKMDGAAKRSMREVYFDFAPKLTKIGTGVNKNSGPINSYDTAPVSEIKKDINNLLQDIHPNIGIIKYRLSPCLRAYQEGNEQSEIFQWNITDDEILNYDTSENESQVYTAVFGFGTALDSNSIAQSSTEILLGQNRGILTFAHSIDEKIEGRIGYRFMSDHDGNIRIPILSYLTSYVILMQSQMNMFSAQVTVLGSPKYKPGSIVRLQGLNIDYYCTDVIHNWSMSDGYTTQLLLGWGHTSGILPAALTGGSTNDNIAANAICAKRSQHLDTYVDKGKNIGGVNVQCLISAMWQFMTCSAITNTALIQATPEYQNMQPNVSSNSNSSGDWIIYRGATVESRHNPSPGYVGGPITQYDSQIINKILYYHLDQYNVTLNAVRCLINAESSWYADAISPDLPNHGYGWFQLTKHENQISDNNAMNDFTKACGVAMGVLRAGMVAACNGNPANATGRAWLAGFALYNAGAAAGINAGNVDLSPTGYVSLVFGPDQVQAITRANNPQVPGNSQPNSIYSGLSCQPQQTGLQGWPYPVYGPIGERLDAYKQYNKNVSDISAKQHLTDFDTGMKAGVTYITSLLNKYNSIPLPNSGQYINENDLMQKVIAAWYSNENIASLSPNSDISILRNAVKALTILYNECTICTGNISTANTNVDNSKNLALNQIKWRIPVNNPYCTSPFGYRVLKGAASDHHYGCDWVNDSTPSDHNVYAPADGIVIFSGNSGNAGWMLIILHSVPSHGIVSRILDLAFPPYVLVKVGDKVSLGQQIGYMGPYEGTGFHCHHEIHMGYPVQSTGNGYIPQDGGNKYNATDPMPIFTDNNLKWLGNQRHS